MTNLLATRGPPAKTTLADRADSVPRSGVAHAALGSIGRTNGRVDRGTARGAGQDRVLETARAIRRLNHVIGGIAGEVHPLDRFRTVGRVLVDNHDVDVAGVVGATPRPLF